MASIFDGVNQEEQGTVFDGVTNPEAQPTPALPNKTLMTALANYKPANSPTPVDDESLNTARHIIETGQEMTVRNQLAADRTLRQAAALNQYRMSDPLMSPELKKGADEAYTRVIQGDNEAKARTAIENEAIDRIQELAGRDPVQARVLIDNFEKGNSEQTMRDFTVKQMILQQRAEELDNEKGQEGWGHWALNMALGLFPLNYNAQRSSVVGKSSWGDFLQPGTGLRHQSEELWNMNPEDFAKYAAKDGPLMQSIRDNATSPFGLTYDPAAASDILDNLKNQSDSARIWSNVWGGAEIAMIPGISKVVTAPTKLLTRLGAKKEAEELLGNAADRLIAEGPEAMRQATGVTEKELADASTVSIVDPTVTAEHSAPMALDLADRMEAAKQALAELPKTVQEFRLTNPSDIQDAYDSVVKRIRTSLGKRVKDIKREIEYTTDGREVRYVESTWGRKGGGGFASAREADKAAVREGYAGTQTVGETTVKETRVPDTESGFDIRGYHGTGATFDQFSNDFLGTATHADSATKGHFFVDNPDVAWTYSRSSAVDHYIKTPEYKAIKEDYNQKRDLYNSIRNDSSRAAELPQAESNWREALSKLDNTKQAAGDGNIRPVALRLKNPLIHDFEGQGYEEGAFNRIIDEAQQKGHDGVIFKNADDSIGGNPRGNLDIAEGRDAKWSFDPHTVYAVFDTNNIRSTLDNYRIVRDESGQWYVKTRVNVSEDGFYTNELQPAAQGFIGRLTGRFWRDSSRLSDPELHGKAVQAGSSIQKRQTILHKMTWNTYKSLNHESQRVIDQLGLLGANRERWWSDHEFNALVRQGFKRDATEKELEVYQKLRLFNDMDYLLRNEQMKLDKAVRGYESMEFKTVNGSAYDLDGHINYSPDTVPFERVYNVSDNVHYHNNNPLTADQLDRYRNNGYVLVTPEEAISLPGDIVVKKILIKRSDLKVKPLRDTQLAYTEGGHRLYTSKYFVKQAQTGVQGDTGKEFLKSPNTFVTARNIAEAHKWADTMNYALSMAKKGSTAEELDRLAFKGDGAFPTGDEFLDRLKTGFISKDHKFEALFDREMPEVYNKSGVDVERFVNEDEQGFNGYYRTTGKMYTSAKGEVLKDTYGKISETVNPFEAINTSLKQITRQSGIYGYKQEALERFTKSFAEDLDIPKGVVNPYEVLVNAPIKGSVGIEKRNLIEGQRAAIKHVLGFQSDFDNAKRELWRSTAEWVLGTGDNAARKFGHDAVWWFKEKNPVSFIRGLAFDAKLGLFNVGQLFIQTSTMASAIALNPVSGLRGFAGMAPMHAFLLSRGSEGVLDTLAKRGVGKLMGFETEKEFKQYARQMHQSGFLDMNGSHIMIGDNGPDAVFGTFGETVDRVREAGRTFFYQAETMNRLVSYRIAWDEALKQGLKPGEPGWASAVAKHADDYSMNMTSQSAAYWQKGVLSIPTQFWAYNVRMMDAMLGSRFTKAQRLRLALVNLGVAGSAGIPFVEGLSSYLKNQNGQTPDINTLMGTLDRGVVDRMFYELSGADVRIGEKLGSGGWVTDLFQDIFGMSDYGEKSLDDMIGGASWSILKSASKSMAGAAYWAVAESGADISGEHPFLKEDVNRLFMEVSTFGNVTKAIMAANYGTYMSKKGTVLLNDLPPADAAYIALGFRPEETDKLAHMSNYLSNQKEEVAQAATKIRNWRQEAFTNPDKYDENMKKVNLFVQLLPSNMRKDVLKKSKATTDRSFYEHVARKYTEETQQQGVTK